LISLDPPSGTRDFYPDDMRLRTYLFGKFREASVKFGFQEYDAPVLENEELYKRKAGEEITDQMYNFVDKENNRVTLRPEMTPTLVRMVMGKMRLSGEKEEDEAAVVVTADSAAVVPEADGEIDGEEMDEKALKKLAKKQAKEDAKLAKQLVKDAKTSRIQTSELFPLKWFSIPQCWRFETTQRGRKREHYQWNLDIVGSQAIMSEIELLACMVEFFTSCGLTSEDVGIKVNSRKILNEILSEAKVPQSQLAQVCVIVDKLDKIGKTEVENLLVNQLGLNPECAANVVSGVVGVEGEDGLGENSENASEAVNELKTLFKMAESYGIEKWLIFDRSVVRGLAYYTGVVWEAFDRRGVLRAIAGGGRYDMLFSLYGAPQPVPCVGFGFGDCVIMELLREKNLLPLNQNTVDFVVAAYPGCREAAMKVASLLRSGGKSVDMYLEDGKKIGNLYKFADKVGARYMAFAAPAEIEKGLVRIKDLRSGSETERIEKDVKFEDLKTFSC